MKKTAKFYKENPEARTKKKAYDSEYQKKPSAVKLRVDANRANRIAKKNGTAKKGDGLDASHKGGKVVGFEPQSTNRGRKEKSRLKGSKRS